MYLSNENEVLKPLWFLTTSDWFTHEEYIHSDYPIREIATFVGNNISFGKPLKCTLENFKESPVYYLGDLAAITEDQLIYHSKKQDDWDLDYSTAKDLVDQEVYIAKCVYIPDNLNISQETQDDIMLCKLNAIIYNFAQELDDDFIILNNKSSKYMEYISEACGYLDVGFEEYQNDKLILSNVDPVIMNLNPLVNFVEDGEVGMKKYFPTWIYNSHPYAQREFLKLIVAIQFSDLTPNFQNSWGARNLQHLGARCGMPVSFVNSEKRYVFTDKMKKVKIYKYADHARFEAASIKIEPTNIMLFSNNEECFVNCG